MIHRVARGLRRLESALLVGLLGAMIGVAVYQVLARNLFDAGLVWGDPMVRIALLWVTLVGGMAASASDRHIRIGEGQVAGLLLFVVGVGQEHR